MKKEIKMNKFNLTFICTIILSILGSICARIGTHNYEEIKIKYNEEKNINYKVYLKENNFFEEEYLEKNQTYITSLIDHLEIDFDYDLKLDEKMSGDYSYYIKGTISADKTNGGNGNYWQKEYNLTPKTEKKYQDSKKIKISDKITINYQEYNDILTSFKKEYGLAMDGNLKIELVIKNNITNDKLDRTIVKKENLELNIPLTSLTIEVPIESNVKDTKGYLVNELVYNDHIIFTILEYLSYLMFSVVAVGITYLIVIIIKSESIYNRKLNKILKTYDGILVEINALPKLKNMEIISVKSFNELIDAHSEIRKPISFAKNINSVTFILINEGIVWTYTLHKRAYQEEA